MFDVHLDSQERRTVCYKAETLVVSSAHHSLLMLLPLKNQSSGLASSELHRHMNMNMVAKVLLSKEDMLDYCNVPLEVVWQDLHRTLDQLSV